MEAKDGRKKIAKQERNRVDKYRSIRKKKAKFFREKKPTVPENHPVLADERVLETAQQLTTNNEPPPPQQQSCSAMERKLSAPIERTPVKISHKRCSTETPLAYGNVVIPSEGYKIIDSCILQTEFIIIEVQQL